MFDWLTGGVSASVEKVAAEWIDTAIEKGEGAVLNAQAETLVLKTLDPNGKMRRDLSKFACIMYALYLIPTMFMVFMVGFGIGDAQGAKVASEMLTELFLPITGAWGAIVGASFGVNGVNAHKGR